MIPMKVVQLFQTNKENSKACAPPNYRNFFPTPITTPIVCAPIHYGTPNIVYFIMVSNYHNND